MASGAETPGALAVAMSGGVDSSVAAWLLARKGYTLTGVHIRMWTAKDPTACARQDRNIADAQRVCDRIGIPFELVDLREAFQIEVVDPFLQAYREGRTPNPCIICNPRIKMGRLLEWARERGLAGVATGHYARVGRNANTTRWELRRSADPSKDQTYYLYRLEQEQLARFHTPVGEYTKDQIRTIATNNDLRVSHKEESQDICFIPDDNYRRFLEETIDDLPPEGPIVNREGKVLGSHSGIHRYTIGQRRGLGVSNPAPLYVLKIRPAENTVVVGEKEHLQAEGLEARNIVWGALPELKEKTRLRVKVRYRSTAVPAWGEPAAEGVHIRFDEPQRAITPGQSAVFYDMTDDLVLGGGFIEKALSESQP
ncbi:tRNA 2-thiouridine(34) synthase MnmA [bacterium]|nr:tRNA 2-thiouridine(34) synthase MnmA [bacterium]